MEITIRGRKFTIGFGKKKDENPVDPAQFLSEKSFAEYIENEVKRTGKSKGQILGKMFNDGWLTFMIEESGGVTKIDASQLFKDAGKKADRIKEYTRLRDDFAPISNCVDYIKDQILGGGVGVLIDDNTDKSQKELKEELEALVEDIYQDYVTRSLRVLLPILVDNALTTGVSAAEITYKGKKTFFDYAIVASRVIKVDGKEKEFVIYETEEPDWKTDLQGITRLKIMDNAYKRFVPQRDPNSWEIKYWVLDEGKGDKNLITLSTGMKVRASTNKIAGTYLHPWQVFWLTLRRKGFGVKGESVIKPVYGTAILLEKIMKAVGEGIHRAGNKKYFIVCGTKERPWSGPHIRNVLQQLKEASKKNWSTIPMPQGFDVKDIGGEVFEAHEVVDYFLKTIAGAMKVPAEVVGVEVREQKKYSYTEYKLNLLLAIKHQLFKQHIWCLHGKTKTKQSGRSTEPTYVPSPRFKVEDLLTLREKLKMYIDSLNAANPLHPAIKLKTETEYCRAMGWDDVLLPTQEEYKKELEAAKELAEKKMKAGPEIVGEKKQGDPAAQTEERQKKRLAGMTKKGEDEKGKAKKLGSTRIPTEAK